MKETALDIFKKCVDVEYVLFYTPHMFEIDFIVGVNEVERHVKSQILDDIIEQMTIWHDMEPTSQEMLSLLHIKKMLIKEKFIPKEISKP